MVLRLIRWRPIKMRFFMLRYQALDLALHMRVSMRAANMLKALHGQPLGEFVREDRRPIVREPSKGLSQRKILAIRSGHSQVQRLADIACGHACHLARHRTTH